MPRINVESAASVIDPYHPNNYPHEHGNESGRYTYRARRVKKLKFTLGWELEANHVPSRFPAGVSHIGDGSVNGDGAEFVVLPAITRSPRYVLALLKELVHAPRLNTDKSCGYHVHVSASNVKSVTTLRQWAIATEQLAMAIEDLAFKAVPDARQSNQYCRRIRPIQTGMEFSASKYSNERRYNWFNTVEIFRPSGIRTMEIRLLGNTHRWKYLLAWTLFSMELARRGWELMHNPFHMENHVNNLSLLLKRITEEIKPIEKRHEPIPQWVYSGLKEFGIMPDAWERPLAKLSEVESDVKGLPKKYYSDNQATEENVSEDEENDDSCPCGCGEEGRCESQTHSDGDCDSNYCFNCHDEGECGGSPDCERCIDSAHDNGENCGRSTCRTCQRRTVTPASDRPVAATSANTTVSDPLNVDIIRDTVREMRNVRMDNAALFQAQAYNATLYGQSIVELVNDGFTLEVNAAELERIALTRMTRREQLECMERETRRGQI